MKQSIELITPKDGDIVVMRGFSNAACDHMLKSLNKKDRGFIVVGVGPEPALEKQQTSRFEMFSLAFSIVALIVALTLAVAYLFIP